VIERKGTWLAVAVAMLPLSGIITAQAPPQTGKNPYVAAIEEQIAGKEQQPAEQVFKDIRVFKGMPAIRVLRIMEAAFNANLGVNCEHCHAVDDWSSGVKPQRDIAREMWTLRADLQERLRKITGKADLPVTCYTCHKGQPKPAFAPDK
jgi:hypothetical protein